MKKLFFSLCCLLASCGNEIVTNSYPTIEQKEFEANFKSFNEKKSAIAPFQTRASSALTEEEVLNLAAQYDSVTSEFICENKKVLAKYSIPISKDYRDLLLLDMDLAKKFIHDNFSKEFNVIFWNRMEYYCSKSSSNAQAPKIYNVSSLNPMENLILSEMETTNELMNLTLDVVGRQIPTTTKDDKTAHALKECEAQMNSDRNKCSFMFFMGIVASVVVAPETLGTGTVIEYVVNCMQYENCLRQAAETKKECDKRARGN